MGRLINADELLRNMDTEPEYIWFSDEYTYGMNTEREKWVREISDTPTVDAIPISYIRDWIERHPTDCNTVEGMLMDWREEGMNGV